MKITHLCANMHRRIAVLYDSLFLISLQNCIVYSSVAVLIYCSTNSVKQFPFLWILTNICYFFVFWKNYPNGWSMTFHCGFSYISLMSTDKYLFLYLWQFLYILLYILYIFFEEMTIYVIWLLIFLCYWVVWVPPIF